MAQHGLGVGIVAAERGDHEGPVVPVPLIESKRGGVMSVECVGRFGLMVCAVVVSACGSGETASLPTQAGSGASSLEASTVDSSSALARARSATARYHDVAVAIADGFVQASPCVAAPGLGTMGFHYIDFSRMNPTAEVARPEALLYVPEDGELRLVAVEYIVPVFVDGAPYFGPTPPADPGPAPVLFGQTFEGPAAPPGAPWQFSLHAWIWSHNPAGTFAPFNPALSCGS